MGKSLENRVCVILPTFNRADLISETIDSLLSQTRPVHDILVIDDGSTDETAERVAAFGNKVRYHKKENGGKAAALNLGLRMTNAAFVWICDDDDLLLPDACERIMSEFEADPTLDYCAGTHQDFYVDPSTGKKVITEAGYVRWSSPAEIFRVALDGCNIWQPGLIVRRSVYDSVGDFDEALIRSQDYEMLLRVTRAYKGLFLQEPVFLHREHKGERGSAAERFPIEEANHRWIEYNRSIVKPLLAELSDQELLSPEIWAQATLDGTEHRLATIRRGAILGRHGMWAEAIATWTSLQEGQGSTLGDLEVQMVRESTIHSLSCQPLLASADMQAALQGLKSSSPLGRQIVKQLGSSVLWRLKKAAMGGKVQDVLTLTRFVATSF